MANRLVNMMSTFREVVRNLILGYPSLTNKIFEIFLGEIHKVNPEILGYPRIPGYPLTTSLGLPDASLTCTTQVRSMVKFLSTRIFHIIIITLREEKLGRTISNSKVFESKWNMVMVWREIFLKKKYWSWF